MAPLKVTIIDPLGDNSFQVELPNDAPMNQLVPQLLPKIGITGQGTFQVQHKRTERILGPNDTLHSAGVQEGDVLRIVQAASAA